MLVKHRPSTFPTGARIRPPNAASWLRTSASYPRPAMKESDFVSLVAPGFRPFLQQVTRKVAAYEPIPVDLEFSIADRFLSDDCNSAFNEQIDLEHSVAVFYQELWYYFRYHTRLKYLPLWFLEATLGRWNTVKMLLSHQGKGRGDAKILHIPLPIYEFYSAEQGVVLQALEIAQSLEKMTYEKLTKLLSVARRCNDPETEHFLNFLLVQQIKRMRSPSAYVSELREDDRKDAAWQFDQDYFAYDCTEYSYDWERSGLRVSPQQSVATKGFASSNESIASEPKPAVTETALLAVLEKFFQVVLNLPSVNKRFSDELDVLSSQQPRCP